MSSGIPDLVPIWTAIIALSVFLYVLLDGFDLGIGILYGFAPAVDRPALMNAIAPAWDGNETWLVLVGLALLAVFPLAFAIIVPAVYFPVLVMLLAMVFRGVAFEFRFEHQWLTRLWAKGFCAGSAVATFAQGALLGAFIQGFTVQDRSFAGSSWDWLTPFSVLTGLALMAGYGLLGAGWLVIKTEGALEVWARRAGRVCLSACLPRSWPSASGRRCCIRRSPRAGSAGQTCCCWHRCRSLRWCWPRRRGVRWAAGAVTPLRS